MNHLPPSSDRISVVILGATGMVGQRLIERLSRHAWFRISALCASEHSAGKPYGEAARWRLPTPLDPSIAQMTVQACDPDVEGTIALSGLDSAVAGPIERSFAEAGHAVVSNAKNHRMDRDVPLLIPEVNPGHLHLITRQPFGRGCVVTNPNCSTVGVVMALKPLHDAFGVEAADITTLQAASGAGYPGVPSLDLIDNVIPFIDGEEEKLATEPKKILGTLTDQGIEAADMRLSAQCNRVPVIDGHIACVKVGLRRRATRQHVEEVLQNFRPEIADLHLPSAPDQPIIYLRDDSHPQPRLHRDLGHGMTVSVGRLQESDVLDFKFVVLSHNTIRGAAGAAILNAELLVRSGLRDVLWAGKNECRS